MQKILLPKGSEKYVLFQRTTYLKSNFLARILGYFEYYKPFFKPVTNLKAFLFPSKISVAFSEDMNKEYDTIKSFLPEKTNSILDIGCGVAGIDVLISRHYQNNIDIFLLDKTFINDSVYYSFKEKGAFYNSLQVAKKLLEINGTSPDKIHMQEVQGENKINFQKQFDIVISLISWGFHYPVSTYLDSAYEKLVPGGILIIDIRKDTSGEREIADKFGNCRVILNSEKFVRVLAKKQPL